MCRSYVQLFYIIYIDQYYGQFLYIIIIIVLPVSAVLYYRRTTPMTQHTGTYIIVKAVLCRYRPGKWFPNVKQ